MEDDLLQLWKIEFPVSPLQLFEAGVDSSPFWRVCRKEMGVFRWS